MKRKKLLSLITALSLALSLAACSDDDAAKESSPQSDGPSSSQTDSSGSDTPAVAADGFYVSGTKLYDANGNEFVMRGVNHAHTWFKSDLDMALIGIADTGANTVRIVLSDGEQWEKDSLEDVKMIIEKCIEKELVAVLEVHDATGNDSISSLENAADYWVEMKDALIGNEEYVILNIANEWTGNWDSYLWAEGYTKVIPEIRDAGIKNTIMVDAGGWGQYGKSIEDLGKDVFESDPLSNTMFSVHMYGTAGKNEKTIRDNIEGATDQGLCIIVGEFGYTHTDGDVDEGYILEYCNENSIGYLAWSWKGNGGGVEYLDLSYDWVGKELSPDWGEVVINGKNGIRETAVKCSIFS